MMTTRSFKINFVRLQNGIFVLVLLCQGKRLLLYDSHLVPSNLLSVVTLNRYFFKVKGQYQTLILYVPNSVSVPGLEVVVKPALF